MADYADMVREVDSLVDRYANDAWRRVQGVAHEMGTSDQCPPAGHPSGINLTAEERGRFHEGFLSAEIYLLSTFHTDAQGQRHRFDMGLDLFDHVQLGHDRSRNRDRRQLDSCMRYIFHAYRAHLRGTARRSARLRSPRRSSPRMSHGRSWRLSWRSSFQGREAGFPRLLPRLSTEHAKSSSRQTWTRRPGCSRRGPLRKSRSSSSGYARAASRPWRRHTRPQQQSDEERCSKSLARAAHGTRVSS